MPAGADAFGTEKTTSTSAPARTELGLSDRCAPAGAATASAAAALQTKVPSDDHPLHLIRSLADLEDLLVAVEARDGVLVHEPVAAVDLERPVRDAVRELAGVELGHRGLLREWAALVLEPCCAVDERAPGLDLDGHVDEPVLNRLELLDLLAELLALVRVSNR